MIIGGGINGIGTFRDLALNGLSTSCSWNAPIFAPARVRRHRIWPTCIRLSGEREFRLVREAVQERNA